MHTTAKLTLAGLASAALLTGSAVATPDGTARHQPSAHRGQVVESTYLRGFTARQVDDYVAAEGVQRPISRYGVELYRVVYRTIDPGGRPTRASGLVTLPRSPDRTIRLSTYLHGTTTKRDDVASVSDDSTDRAISMLLGGTGLAVAAPDYLGLGVGPGRHPYVHLPSETTASEDMLVATRELAGQHGRRVADGVSATGFSQGGRVAVNLGKQLQAGRVPGFRLDRVAGVAGPYDIRGAELPAAFDGRLEPKTAAYYLGYFTTAWKRFGLYDDPAEVFRAPYDTTMETLFDGRHTDEQIVAGLPASAQELLQPAFVQRLMHPTGRLAKMLRTGDQSCRGWTPKSPVRIYYGTADTDVAPANAQHCLSTLPGSKGVNLGALTHFETGVGSYPSIAAWFSRS